MENVFPFTRMRLKLHVLVETDKCDPQSLTYDVMCVIIGILGSAIHDMIRDILLSGC